MDRVLKSYSVYIRYDTTVVPKSSAPETLDGKATERKFHAIGSALESNIQKQNADKPLMLGRLLAAAINQQGGLEKLYNLTSFLRPERGSEITVSIDGLAWPVTWWVETTIAVAYDEWIETSNENVAKVLVPMIKAWKAGSQATKQGKGPCGSCQARRTV
ncbi:hypothetical protein HD806DRAFT_532129 [Xylariaceae sp. AK1471]|nr:hypothetical protein HD806DRAFT_532129 [Xylariaceae sp. AK1471]